MNAPWPPPGIDWYYADDSCCIACADCRDILPRLPKVDLVLTDPPYGINHASNHVCDTTTAAWMKQTIANDGSTELRDYVLAGVVEWACFGSPAIPAPLGARDILIWDKGPASGMGDLSWPFKRSWEMIFLSGEGWIGSRDEGVIKGKWVVTRASMGRDHPNEKPVSLMVYLASKHTGQLILDPFMGVATTLRAAKDLGRRAIGIDTEERYCRIGVERLRQEVLPIHETAKQTACQEHLILHEPRER